MLGKVMTDSGRVAARFYYISIIKNTISSPRSNNNNNGRE